MNTLLVTYDLRKPGQKYDEFHSVLRKYSWARLSESSYAIATTETPEVVYARLRPHVDANDYLYVITLTGPYTGQGKPEVNQWLAGHLRAGVRY